jgi:hypothetical protein
MKSGKVYAQRNVIWDIAAFQGMFRSENVDVFLPCASPKGYVGMRMRRHGPRQMRWHFSCKKWMRHQCGVGVPDHIRPERRGQRNPRHRGFGTVHIRERIGERRGSLERLSTRKRRCGGYHGIGRVRVRRARRRLGGRSKGGPAACRRGGEGGGLNTDPAATSGPSIDAEEGGIWVRRECLASRRVRRSGQCARVEVQSWAADR